MVHRTPTTVADIPQSRQEALRIRQALTLYLRSHVVFADENTAPRNGHAQSHLSLCVPHDAVIDVKRPPSEVTGLRKEYLEALRANLAARREYQALCEKTGAVREVSSRSKEGGSAVKSSLELQAYLRLLRDRRRHAKLQVFQHYLQGIKARNSTHVEDFDTRESRGEQVASLRDLDAGGSGSGGGAKPEDCVEELMHKLERAVIRAQAQLNSEKKLLEEFKALQTPAADAAPALKLAALQRTRDELVHWVEEKLVSEGDGEEAPLQEIPAEEIEESTRLLEDQKVQVVEQYAAYVDARKRLLDAASRACQPITVAPARSPDRVVEPRKTETLGEPVSLDPAGVLSFTSDILLPMAKGQRALALQKSYLAGMLAKEKSTALRVLNRLSDESHLLPEYPLLARQPRFQHATAALRSRQTAAPAEMKPDEVVRLAEAWAFASEAARTNERQYVEQKVTEGRETAEDAEQVLQEVYGLLDQNLGEALQEDNGDGGLESDVWASEALSTRPQAKLGHRNKRPQGPWSGLDGRVGVGIP
ncbi:hypothetical protein HFD88_009994 [Aspergillus terreus]|nr:hypothetical protein HFD88_009994 [Aspergillus terreus]